METAPILLILHFMKSPLPRFLSGLAVVSLVSAQSVPGNQVLTATDRTVTLNPFVISVDADDGYAPTETLSGTRLKTPVKDVPSAISIISADMLADLGALNFNDVLDFLPSTARYQSNEGDLDNNG